MSDEEAAVPTAASGLSPVATLVGTIVVGLLIAVVLRGNMDKPKAVAAFSDAELAKESAAAGGSGGGKKKKSNKKKKKPAAKKQQATMAAKKPEPEPEPEPESEPEPEPEVIEEPPAPAPAPPPPPPPAPAPAPPPPPPVVEEPPQPENGGSKKKKKKKKNKAKEASPPEPEPEPEPAPAPAPPPPPPPPPEPEVVPEATGKKKKKKKKKKAANGETKPEEAAAAAPPEPEEEEEQWEQVKKGSRAQALGNSKAEPADPNQIQTVQMGIGADTSLIIGPQGATIRMLQASTGCKFDIVKDTWQGTDHQVKITGTGEQCEQAKAAIQEILDEEAARKARQVVKTLKFDEKDAIKAVIGKGGATIQDIEKRTNCKVEANVELGTCIITGEQPGVDKAVTLCNNAVYGEAQDTLNVKTRSAVNLIFGKNFETIRKFQDESGAKLDLDRDTTTLKLSGSRESVAKAREMVEKLLQVNQGVEFAVKPKSVGAIYGKAGATIRSIQDRTNTFIEVNDADGSGADATCFIMGEPKGVAEARRLIQMAIDGEEELKPGQVLHTLDLGPGAPAVIGKGGSRVVELEKKHGVKIKVNSDTALCRIVGMKKNAGAAKDEVENIIKPFFAEIEAAKLAAKEAEKGDSAWSGAVEDDDLDGW